MKKKNEGVSSPSHQLWPIKENWKQNLKRCKLSQRCFAVYVFCCFGDGTERNLQLFHPCGGTITYCSPMLENTIHQAWPAQWAESDGCFGTHEQLHLLQPQDCWMTQFIQFCLWHFSNPWKTGFLLFTNKSTQNGVCLSILTKTVKTKPAAHSKKLIKAGKWKIICPRRKCIYCTADSYHASHFTGNKTRQEIIAYGNICRAAV